MNADTPVIFSCDGYCPSCDQEVKFEARFEWFRDHLLCPVCGSIPRERALMTVLEEWYPNWRELCIHESSPAARGTSLKLAQNCPGYLETQYRDDVEPGTTRPGSWRCEDLERQTFEDESFDLVVTQDVLEHVFDPAAVFREIARTLRPGGAHVFTAPLVNKTRLSQVRARRLSDASIEYVGEPEYHGNPVDDQGSLVTMDWGYDIVRHIWDACGLFTILFQIDDLSRGIRAEYIEVGVTQKPATKA